LIINLILKKKCNCSIWFEKTVSYGGGTRNGPKEIIKASHQVELYDEELNCEPYKKIGIKTLKPFKIDKNIKKALNKISKLIKKF
jgi:agmatinase